MKSKSLSHFNHHQKKMIHFIKKTQGFDLFFDSKDEISVYQKVDGKSLNIKFGDIEEVLERTDSKGDPFIQVNFYGDKKIILTDKFIGFKPFPVPQLDMTKLPKVVTTPDLLNFIEVIEDSMYEIDVVATEIQDIRKYFQSVLLGAEKVGFDMLSESVWIEKLFLNHPALITQVA